MEPSPSPSVSQVTISDPVYGTVITILAGALLILPVLGGLGTIFLWRVYLSDVRRPRSWVLLLMSSGSTLVSLASLGMAFLALRRFTGAGPFPEGAIILAFSVFLLESIPIWYAITIYRKQRIHRKELGIGDEVIYDEPQGSPAGRSKIEVEEDARG